MSHTVRVFAVALALGVMTATHSYAQGPTIGFKLGASFSNLDSNAPGDDGDAITKFTGGGFIRFGLGPVDIQPELMYVTKGTKSDLLGADFELRLDYVEIPVLLMVPLTRGGGVAPYIYLGPAFSFEAGCSVRIESTEFNGSFDCDALEDEEDEEVVGERKKWDIGAMVGGGISIPAGPGSLLLEARYNFGLMNLDDSPEDVTIKNRSGAVLVGFSIPIGRR